MEVNEGEIIMAYEFTKAAKEAYGFSGLTQKVLWFLCDEISASQKAKYMKSRVGFVCRSYDYLAFRNACSRKALTAVFKSLTEAGVLKAVKRGPHKFYLFCIYLDKLIAMRRTWQEEKIFLRFKDLDDADPMDVAEEELQWEDEAAEEAAGEEGDGPIIDPTTEEELGEDFPETLPEVTSDSLELTSVNQRLPEVRSTLREVMSGKPEVMSGSTGGNVWKSKNGVETTDSKSIAGNAEKSIGLSLSGAFNGVDGESLSSVPQGPRHQRINSEDQSQRRNPTPKPATDPRDVPDNVCRHNQFRRLCPQCKQIEDTRSWATTPSKKKPSRVPIFDTSDID